jgi:hypothetical protein
MPLLNYTTSVPVSRTVNEVHKLLIAAGARRIMTEYDADGRPTGVAFTVATAHGERSFLVPVNAGQVEHVLARQRVEARYRRPEHAERVAWRIVKDWLEAQLAIIRTEMVTLEQVMLPYMATEDGRTMWALYLDRQLALPTAD